MIPPESLKENPLIEKITTIKEAIKFLEWCRDIHQAYIDNPHWRRGNVGKTPHHQSCVEKYNEIINLIKKRRKKNEQTTKKG